jgi:microsomal epoxide hydrolase
MANGTCLQRPPAISDGNWLKTEEWNVVTAQIRPFRIDVPDARIARIRERLGDAQLTYAPDDDGGWRYGTDVAYLQTFIAYWLEQYDWRAAERVLNRYDQFLCNVEGIDIHFLHLRGGGTDRTLLMTHGWPGSTYEFHEAAARLAAAGFDLVIPSLPGYGFSGRPGKPIGPRQTAALWRSLMVEKIGIARFGIQGGDWGSAVSMWLANDAPEHVLGLHLNMCLPPAKKGADAAEETWRAQVGGVMRTESGYMFEQMTKPQTIALALADNPAGYAAWVLEKFHGWGDTRGDIESRFSRDWLITNLMIHLVNDATTSMIWMYHGAMDETIAGQGDVMVRVPTACALFPGEFLPWPPRPVAERYFNVARWTEMKSGGHFAALEEPAAFANDVAAFFEGIM